MSTKSDEKVEMSKFKSVMPRILKYTSLSGLVLVFGVFVVNTLWVASGSNEWELQIDENGVQVYTLKSPGSRVMKFKGVAKYDYSLSQMLASFNDETITENCDKYMPGCVEYRFVDSWNPTRMYNTQYWRFEMFGPFADREMVLRGTLSQDSETKEVLLHNIAVPNMIEPSDCCVRVSFMHNTWRYTPQEDGRLQVEYVQDFDMGGFFPSLLLNLGAPEVHVLLHSTLPSLIESKEEYAQATLDFIEEF